MLLACWQKGCADKGFWCTQFLDTGIEKLGVPYSYGFAIILLTVLVKAATYPLSRKQVQL